MKPYLRLVLSCTRGADKPMSICDISFVFLCVNLSTTVFVSTQTFLFCKI